MTTDRAYLRGVGIYFYDSGGSCPPVVLAGSLGSDHTMWSPQIAFLESQGWRVIAPDTRGHGQSDVPPGPYTITDLAQDLGHLVDALSMDAIHLIGLSLGAMASLAFAAASPERVTSLAVIATAANLGPADRWHGRADAVAQYGMGAVASETLARWVTEAYASGHPAEMAHLRRMLEATPRAGYAACCRAIADMDLRPSLSSIKAPCLVVAGGCDVGTPPIRLREIAKAINNAEYVEVPHGAHLLSWEYHEDVNMLLQRHLTRS